ncbi:MAG: homogentisate 1,2-dioxygenase [Acidimicrobiia bacterium]
MPIYQVHGQLPPKHYTLMRGPLGSYCHEELLTNEGFDGEYSLLYRLRAPTSMLRSEQLPPLPDDRTDTALDNYLFQMGDVTGSGDLLSARRTWFEGANISFDIAKPDRAGEGFTRNAWSDELVVITEGTGVLRSPMGDLPYKPLDLVLVPRSLTVQWVPDDVPHTMAVVESTSPITIPPSFRNPRTGQFYAWTPYKERDLRLPQFRDPIDETGEFPITVKYGRNLSRFWLDHHPFDVVGWDGYLYPFALNLDDYEPITGRIEKLPDQYLVFTTLGTLMMAVVPRRRPDHPDAIPAQPHHMNTDIDEILFRIGGTNRLTDPGGGTITLHPRGLSHGPRPGFLDQPKTEMLPLYAFMLDTRDHLTITNAARRHMDPNNARNYRPS